MGGGEQATGGLPAAGLLRRLAAMAYDGFLILAIWMLSTLAVVAVAAGLLGVENPGEALEPLALQGFLYLQTGGFYLYFWRAQGQTLGMQVWKIRAVNQAGELMSLGEGCWRFLCASLSLACLGLGLLWMLFDRQGLAWHDRASGTRVVYLGKDAYRG